MTPEQAAALRHPFPPEQIGTLPRGNTKLSYVGHAAVTSRLLEVDPDWSWKPVVVDERGAPLLTQNGLSVGTKMGMWIEMTIAGVTRPGFGDGNSAKECISDAIRNAAMRFGVALDLWAKEDLQGAAEGTAGKTEEAPPRHTPPVSPAGPAETSTQEAAADEGASSDPPYPVALATPQQRRYMFALAKERGISIEKLREIIFDETEQTSTAHIPLADFDNLISKINVYVGLDPLEDVPFA